MNREICINSPTKKHKYVKTYSTNTFTLEESITTYSNCVYCGKEMKT